MRPIRLTSAELGVYTPREMSAYADKMPDIDYNNI